MAVSKRTDLHRFNRFSRVRPNIGYERCDDHIEQYDLECGTGELSIARFIVNTIQVPQENVTARIGEAFNVEFGA